MSDRVAFLEGRSLPRLALTGLALIWLAGCSQDVARFDSSGNPFSNPFASQTAQATPAASALRPMRLRRRSRRRPAWRARRCPRRPPPHRRRRFAARAAGWSAVGGTPVVVASGETLELAFASLRRARVRAAQRERPFERCRGQGRHAHGRSGLQRRQPRRGVREGARRQGGEDEETRRGCRGERHARDVRQGPQGRGQEGHGQDQGRGQGEGGRAKVQARGRVQDEG